ncbi:hypothetical protein AB0J83_38065 [Actinoplanes sp. NPDC049596]|uniref:hypothetical protein n=1 Tax=unclassified Actinoplanes TaxID=2626549 RepID=UPI00341891A2
MIATAVFGLNVVTSGPAAAASGTWRSYENDNNPIKYSPHFWDCAATKEIANDIFAQLCVVKRDSSPHAGTAAVIVRNNRSTLYSAEARGDLVAFADKSHLGYWTCSRSGVGPGTWSVCWGQWVVTSRFVEANAGGVNGVALPHREVGV